MVIFYGKLLSEGICVCLPADWQSLSQIDIIFTVNH